MSRPRQRQQRDYYDDGEERRPLPRRKSNNSSLYIALGSAAAIGLIILLIITGSSDDEQDTAEALVSLQAFCKAALENREKEGAQMIVAREILRDQNPNDTKMWSSLPPERREELEIQAFRWVRGRIIQELQLMSMEQVNNMLRGSDAVPFSGADRVDFQWKVGLDRWNAKMVHIGDRWFLERFDRRDG
jgi:hypothetical protein